jgi:hypothetical protein
VRLGLNVAILGCLFRFRRRTDDFVGELRRSRLLLSRFGDDCRLLPFRFECLANCCAVKDLSPLADRQLIANASHLTVTRTEGRKLGKLVELFLQVKNLFLQIHYVTGAELRQSYSVLCHIELAAQHGLANT